MTFSTLNSMYPRNSFSAINSQGAPGVIKDLFYHGPFFKAEGGGQHVAIKEEGGRC